MKNILFIGAHPDDIEIGAGGTLLRHIEFGDNVFIIVATDGENGAERSVRLKELESSMEHAMIPDENIFLLHLKDSMLFKGRYTLFSEIEKVCNEKGIHRVYTHTKKDYHQDHISVFMETIRAARNIPEILTYETNSSSLSTFSPNHFIDITKNINEKMRLLKFHKSQTSKSHLNHESLLAAAKFRGSQSKTFRYAEAFETIRTISSNR